MFLECNVHYSASGVVGGHRTARGQIELRACAMAIVHSSRRHMSSATTSPWASMATVWRESSLRVLGTSQILASRPPLGCPHRGGWVWLGVGNGVQKSPKCPSKPTFAPDLANHDPFDQSKAMVQVWVAHHAPVHALPHSHHHGAPRFAPRGRRRGHEFTHLAMADAGLVCLQSHQTPCLHSSQECVGQI